MVKQVIVGLLVCVLLLGVGCTGSRKVEATSELGTISRADRIRPGEGPGWRLVMPVVHRNREPRASSWPAALESMFRAAPEALAAIDVSGDVLAGIGLAETLGTWVVPDLSSTQNVVFEVDGLATEVVVKGLRQEESAEGHVATSVEAVEVRSAATLEPMSADTQGASP